MIVRMVDEYGEQVIEDFDAKRIIKSHELSHSSKQIIWLLVINSNNSYLFTLYLFYGLVLSQLISRDSYYKMTVNIICNHVWRQ